MGESKIAPIDAYLMVVTAIIVDLIQLIPIVGSVMDIIAALIFGIWFAHYDISLMKKRPGGFLFTIVAEFIPILDMLPFWTILVITTIRKERAESEG